MVYELDGGRVNLSTQPGEQESIEGLLIRNDHYYKLNAHGEKVKIKTNYIVCFETLKIIPIVELIYFESKNNSLFLLFFLGDK